MSQALRILSTLRFGLKSRFKRGKRSRIGWLRCVSCIFGKAELFRSVFGGFLGRFRCPGQGEGLARCAGISAVSVSSCSARTHAHISCKYSRAEVATFRPVAPHFQFIVHFQPKFVSFGGRCCPVCTCSHLICSVNFSRTLYTCSFFIYNGIDSCFHSILCNRNVPYLC